MRTSVAVILGISLTVSAVVLGSFFYRSRVAGNTVRVVGAATGHYESDVVKWRALVGHAVGLADVQSGYQRTRADFLAFMAELKSSGIKDSEITVQPISRTQTYDNNGRVSGYSFTQGVFIISGDIPTVEKLALNPDELFGKGVALRSSNLEYYFSRLPDIKKELLAEATKDARRRAEEIARNSGARLGPLAMARAGIFQITEPFSTEVSDYGIYNTATRQKDITVTVTCEFRLR
jgi:hypothetical protein